MNKTVSLETAKLLVEKGIVLKTKERCIKWSVEDVILGRKNKLNIPRPDIPELLAELPQALNGYCLHIVNGDHTWEVYYSDDVLFQGKELVIALAQALMWVRSKAEVKNER